jgi:hypothetical protein
MFCMIYKELISFLIWALYYKGALLPADLLIEMSPYAMVVNLLPWRIDMTFGASQKSFRTKQGG